VLPTNTAATKRFTLLPGMTDLRIAASSGVLGGLVVFTYNLAVLGVQSGIQYFPDTVGNVLSPTAVAEPITIPVDTELDSQIDVIAHQTSGTLPLNVFVSALFQVEAVEVYAQVPLPTFVASGTNPAPWQAPTAIAFKTGAAVATTVMVAGVANQKTYLHGWELEADETGSVTVANIDDANGNIYASVVLIASGQVHVTGDHRGLPAPANTDVRLNVTNIGTAASVRARLGYSQA
jgi:hypothetical protein